MKLTSQQVAAVKQELGADSLEEENPAMESLRGAFGDHTFYVGPDGLFIVEPIDNPTMEGTPAQLVLVAAWTDDKKNALEKVLPRETDTIVNLSAEVKGASNGSA